MIFVLLGYMGVGKTTIGKHLAQILNYTFIDLDDYIEKKEQLSVSEIFKTKGEIYFRKKEHYYLKVLLSSKNKIVLAVGGGTPCYAGNMDVITKNDVESFYLQLPPNMLAKRLFNEKTGRPLINNIPTQEKLTHFIAIHLFERQSFYGMASHTINTANLTKQEITEAIVEYLY